MKKSTKTVKKKKVPAKKRLRAVKNKDEAPTPDQLIILAARDNVETALSVIKQVSFKPEDFKKVNDSMLFLENMRAGLTKDLEASNAKVPKK